MSYRIAFSQTAARHLVIDMRRLLDRAGRLRELFSHKSVPRRVAVIDSARQLRGDDGSNMIRHLCQPRKRSRR